MKKTKALVYINYMLQCPCCEHQDKYQDFLSDIGTKLHNDFLRIIQKKPGETNIEVECKKCKETFLVDRFLVK